MSGPRNHKKPAPQRALSCPFALKSRGDTLHRILTDKPDVLAVFTKHLESEYATENLEFWKEVTRYKQLPDVADAINPKQLRLATDIMKAFVTDNGDKQVNLKSHQQHRIIDDIKEGLVDSHTFDDALAEVLNLLANDSFKRFESTTEYEELGHPTIDQVLAAAAADAVIQVHAPEHDRAVSEPIGVPKPEIDKIRTELLSTTRLPPGQHRHSLPFRPVSPKLQSNPFIQRDTEAKHSTDVLTPVPLSTDRSASPGTQLLTKELSEKLPTRYTIDMTAPKKGDAVRTLIRAVDELFMTEKVYWRGLKMLTRVKKWLQTCNAYGYKPQLLSPEDIDNVFGILTPVVLVTENLWKRMKASERRGCLLTDLTHLFRTNVMPSLATYTRYVNHFQGARECLLRNKERNSHFKQYVEITDSVNGFHMETLLNLPIQRVPRYVILLKNILECAKHVPKAGDATSPSYVLHPSTNEQIRTDFERADLEKVVKELEDIAERIGFTVSHWEARARVKEIQAMFPESVRIHHPDRYLVREGALKKVYNKRGMHVKNYKKYWFFLFQDILIYADRPKGPKGLDMKYDYKYTLLVKELEVVDLEDTAKVQNAFSLKTQTSKSFIVFAATPEEKYEWLSDLMKVIQMSRAHAQDFVRLKRQRRISTHSSSGTSLGSLPDLPPSPLPSLPVPENRSRSPSFNSMLEDADAEVDLSQLTDRGSLQSVS